MPRQTHKEWIGKTDRSMPPPSVRLRIFRMHGGRCHICEQKIQAGEPWQADHILAVEDEGENRESNLAPAHDKCHQRKTGQENSRRDHADRMAMKYLGIKKPKGRPMPGGRKSKWKRKISGEVVPR